MYTSSPWSSVDTRDFPMPRPSTGWENAQAISQVRQPMQRSGVTFSL
jgi:hypothetical protein